MLVINDKMGSIYGYISIVIIFVLEVRSNYNKFY